MNSLCYNLAEEQFDEFLLAIFESELGPTSNLVK
jgi:hypothetical protein